MMQLAKKVPFEDPQVLMLVRGMYILSNVLILGIYLYTQAKINSKKGMWVWSLRREPRILTARVRIYRHDYSQVR
jgi:hypothetical protein